jgi:hypothetical protein
VSHVLEAFSSLSWESRPLPHGAPLNLEALIGLIGHCIVLFYLTTRLSVPLRRSKCGGSAHDSVLGSMEYCILLDFSCYLNINKLFHTYILSSHIILWNFCYTYLFMYHVAYKMCILLVFLTFLSLCYCCQFYRRAMETLK